MTANRFVGSIPKTPGFAAVTQVAGKPFRRDTLKKLARSHESGG